MHRFTTRRRFIAIAPALGVTFVAACSKAPEPVPAPPPAPAASPPAAPPAATAPPAASSAASAGMVDEKDAQAQALGYVADATRVEAGKTKAYVAGSLCDGCAQYQGKSGDASGPCTLFQGKQVAAKGWCSAFVKKA